MRSALYGPSSCRSWGHTTINCEALRGLFLKYKNSPKFFAIPWAPVFVGLQLLRLLPVAFLAPKNHFEKFITPGDCDYFYH